MEMKTMEKVYYLEIAGCLTVSENNKSCCFITNEDSAEQCRIDYLKVRVVNADYIYKTYAAINEETTYEFSLKYNDDGVLVDLTCTKTTERFTVDENADLFPRVDRELYDRILEILSSIENDIDVVLGATCIIEMREVVGKEIKKLIDYLGVYEIYPSWVIN